MADYDLVFSGTTTTSGYPPTFTVHRVWKGNVPAKMTLYTVPAIESLTLDSGGSWVVFARRVVSVEDQRERGDTGELWPIHDVSICSPTRPLSEAKDILKQWLESVRGIRRRAGLKTALDVRTPPAPPAQAFTLVNEIHDAVVIFRGPFLPRRWSAPLFQARPAKNAGRATPSANRLNAGSLSQGLKDVH